jgi:signal transduction histidine kinase
MSDAITQRRKMRRVTSAVMTTLTAACALFAVAILLLILGYIAMRGVTSINLQFLIDTPKPVGEGGGIGNAFVGSMVLLAIASVTGLPIGIAAGIYLAEFGDNWFAGTVRFVTDTLTGVPSIVIGVFFDITRLERLERVRQEFLSNVSHELRTPLTAIIAFVETLEEGAIDDTENNRRFLSVIRKNAVRMRNLIDDILELSAIEAGTVGVEPVPLSLRPIIEDVVTALASRADARHVRLHNEVGTEALVYADARRLEQMMTNLVDNAIKFNREGGSVSIRHESAGQRDRITITDTGDGISPEHIERIFERFYRVDRARSREMGGTGLGLAIVKHLARAHGGEATVQSTPGSGSTFTIELPAIDSLTH